MKKLITLFAAAAMCIGTAAAAAEYDASMTYENGTVTLNGLDSAAELIHVSYSDGAPDGVSAVSTGNGTVDITAEPGDRLFLWDSLDGMRPLAEPVTVQEEEGGDVLVVYFSASGNTERVAGYIAEAAGADIFELVPEEPYTSADLNWNNEDSRVVYEYEHPDERDVALVSDTVENWDSYDTVFIGYPIWWGIAAWPVNGFVEANDFTGKTVIPFCTSSSSGMGQSGELLEELAGTGDWQEGRRFRSSASESDVQDWIAELGL